MSMLEYKQLIYRTNTSPTILSTAYPKKALHTAYSHRSTNAATRSHIIDLTTPVPYYSSHSKNERITVSE